MSHLIQNENRFSRKNSTIRHFNRRKFRRHFHTRRPLLTLTGLGCWTWHKLSADREENNKKTGENTRQRGKESLAVCSQRNEMSRRKWFSFFSLNDRFVSIFFSFFSEPISSISQFNCNFDIAPVSDSINSEFTIPSPHPPKKKLIKKIQWYTWQAVSVSP